MLDLLRVALGAGLGPWRALAEVGRRHPGVLAAELGAAARRVALGVPAEAALARLERRCPAAGIAALTAALRRADRLGAPPARALAALAEEARALRARRAAEQAARAGAEDPARRRAPARPVGAAARGGRARAGADRRLALATSARPRSRDSMRSPSAFPPDGDRAERLEVGPRLLEVGVGLAHRVDERDHAPASRAGTTATRRRRARPSRRRSTSESPSPPSPSRAAVVAASP